MIEIDVLPASTETKGGDAVLIRIGDFSYESSQNSQKVILIDSGYGSNAEIIENHIECLYNTKTIDLVIITHPDADHISGLSKILKNKNIKIKKTLIHDPWRHTYKITKKDECDGRRTVNSLGGHFEETLKILSEVLDNIDSINKEPFSGIDLSDFNLVILSPTRQYYQELLLQYPGMDNERKVGAKQVYKQGWFSSLTGKKNQVFLKKPERMTTARNDSSVITLLKSGDIPIALFTGDAGVEALNKALDYADSLKIKYQGVKLFQVPHHGSVKNISEAILNRINPQMAYVSAASNCDERPSKILMNYLVNKVPVYHVSDVSGKVLLSLDGAPPRPGWDSNAKKISEFERVKLLRDEV